MGDGAGRRRPRRPACASRCSTPATCTAASASSSSRRSAGSPTATPRRGRRAPSALRRRAGRAHRRRRPLRAGRRPGEHRRRRGWAAERGAPLHAHVSEQPAENEQSLAAYGCTPTSCSPTAARSASASRPSTPPTSRPATSPCSATARCWCCFCPTTERDLADGIGPARALRDAGARLTLGSDSHAVIDLLEEARAVELDERLATGVRGATTRRRCCAWRRPTGTPASAGPTPGASTPGALADLTTIGLDSVRTAGTADDHALESAVFAATAADVHHVVIGGRVVVRDGRHTTIDVAAELRAVLAVTPGRRRHRAARHEHGGRRAHRRPRRRRRRPGRRRRDRAGAGRRRAHRRRRALRHPGLRRQPHPPRVRRRPSGRVRRPHGRRAVRGRWDQRHDRRDARRDATTSCDALAAARLAEARRAGITTSRSSPATAPPSTTRPAWPASPGRS